MSLRRLTPFGLALILAGCGESAAPPATPPAAPTTPAVAKNEPAAPASEIPPVPPPKEMQKDQEKEKENEAAKLAELDAPKKEAPAVTKSAPAKPADLMAEAAKAAEADELPRAVKLLNEVLAAEPENPQALMLLAQVTQIQAMQEERPKNAPLFLKAAELMRKLQATSKTLSRQQKKVLMDVLYSEACAYASEGKTEQALKSLREAVDNGFDEFGLLATDDDLAKLRGAPEFQKIAKELEEKLLPRAREHAKELLAENKSFPFDFALPDTSGKKVALADLKGKVAIVDIWGTWCPPCRAEIPHFVELYKTYHDKGLEIVGINYENEADDQAAKEVIKKFADEHKVPYPCVIGDDKTQKQVPNFEGFPTTLFIDREGKVRAKIVGFDPSHALELKMLVETLLAEDGPK